MKRLNWRRTTRPTSAWASEEDLRLPDAHLAARDRPRAGARDLRVDVAVDDVVVGAAGAAHGDRADQEEHEVPGVGIGAPGGVGGERRRPPARQEQQPPADRPVEPRQPGIGPPARAGRQRSTQLPRDGIGDVGERCGAVGHWPGHLTLTERRPSASAHFRGLQRRRQESRRLWRSEGAPPQLVLAAGRTAARDPANRQAPRPAGSAFGVRPTFTHRPASGSCGSDRGRERRGHRQRIARSTAFLPCARRRAARTLVRGS